jgi:L-seryl-tRNA(Ser) seleniumtransferase
LPVWAATAAARGALADARRQLEGAGDAGAPDLEVLATRAVALAVELARPHPARVVNATGIVLHTNLGRAPLAPEAAQAVARAAQGYGDLELDLARGERGRRGGAVIEKLRLLSGAADALVVNNNAAAMLLVLAALGAGREVLVSRGELVEIGGSFRVPAILTAAGVRLVEVGTTNRTHAADYVRTIGPNTGLLLKVHRSNFAQSGFVAEVSLRELAEIGTRHALPVVEDLGSGSLVDLSARGFPPESYAPSRLREGADLVCFSGDKLLGGPQAGIVLARSEHPVGAMRAHPLARALRVDKLTLAALDWTLSAHLEGRAERDVPVLRQLLTPLAELEARAQALAGRIAAALPQLPVEVVADRSFAGGGSLPDFALESRVVALRPAGSAAKLAEGLRAASPPILARLRDQTLLLDPRTLEPEDEKHLEATLVSLLR